MLLGPGKEPTPPAHMLLALPPSFPALQRKHVECAELLLGPGKELNTFVARLLDDIANLKAMLQAISIGEWAATLLSWSGGLWGPIS